MNKIAILLSGHIRNLQEHITNFKENVLNITQASILHELHNKT